MGDYIPEFITNPDYEWSYCPYCDYSSLFRTHWKNGFYPKYRGVWTCVCGQLARKKRLFERRNIEPWFIKRTWRKQYYKGDGHGKIVEYGIWYSYHVTYPISQHLDEFQRNMSIDTQLGLRT